MIDDYAKRVLKVLVYIEDHLEDELTIHELAKIACYSPFHFHRLFQMLVGETVGQYVRRLRLEKAAGRLLYSEQPITDIALEAQYETPSAFTKAFKQGMGKPPKHYRTLYKKEIEAMAKKMNELPMIYPDQIEKISDLSLLFIRRTGDYGTCADRAWKAMLAFVAKKQLNKSQLRYFSIAHDNPQITPEEKLRFDACIEVPKGMQEEGEVSRQIIKGGKYAVFTHQGPHQALVTAFDRIFLKWLPESKNTIDESRTPFCELFNLEFVDKDEDQLVTKIYIPLL